MRKLLDRVLDRENREHGFTLIELLVVIIIIGVLAAIAIPIFLNQKKKAADATVRSDVRNAISVVESTFTDRPTVMIKSIGMPSGKNTLTDDAATPNALTGSDVVVSQGNKMSVVGSQSGGYCIVGYNPNGATKLYWYDSATGQTTGSASRPPGTCDTYGVTL